MFDSIISAVIFEFFGALLKWVFYKFYSLFKDIEVPSFGKFWRGRKEGPENLFYEGVSNILLGIIFCIFLLFVCLLIVSKL